MSFNNRLSDFLFWISDQGRSEFFPESPPLEFCFAAGPQFGATQFENRKKLRGALVEELVLAGVPRQSLSQFHDLSKRPTLDGWSISISHSPDMGGFVGIKAPFLVGFDIEEKPRIESRFVKRVSSDAEMMEAPSPAHLWVAKEAAYKSCEVQWQPPVIADIELGGWISFEHADGSNRDWVAFPRAKNLRNSSGLWRCFVMDTENMQVAVSIFLLNFGPKAPIGTI